MPRNNSIESNFFCNIASYADIYAIKSALYKHKEKLQYHGSVMNAVRKYFILPIPTVNVLSCG